MARPTHRLDIHLVPTQRDDGAVERVQELFDAWVAAGWMDAAGIVDPASPIGPCSRVRIDDPGRVVVYANAVGGFQVRCPRCGAPAARSFRPFAQTHCDGCGGDWTIEQLDCRPPVALGRASLVVVNAENPDPPLPDGMRIVWRRL